MFCPNCGASTQGKFCEKCGAAVAGTTSTGSSSVPPVMTAAGLPMNIASALCYIVPVVCPIIFLVVDPYKQDKTVRFSAFQSLFLAIALVIVNEATAIALSGSFDLSFTLYKLLRLAEFLLFCYLAFKAYQNQKIILPGVGPLAQKQA